ncbi:hypothetical protein CRENBAI_009768, partial [Crenichthys baileyi]
IWSSAKEEARLKPSSDIGSLLKQRCPRKVPSSDAVSTTRVKRFSLPERRTTSSNITGNVQFWPADRTGRPPTASLG